ncbi:hypothetical protein SAMN04487897_10273 [Paenibacillus sp. yr247]|nr:hypothetical protein SAMN04487897_10273 [Paenibacillus sp. yr247]
MQQQLKEHGYFNYRNSNGFLETNTSVELSLLIMFDLLSPEDQSALIGQLTSQLETKNNQSQQYGDWGIMTAFPFYHNVHLQVEKSMAPYRYHNGGDWPYWDGVYAMAKLMKETEAGAIH